MGGRGYLPLVVCLALAAHAAVSSTTSGDEVLNSLRPIDPAPDAPASDDRPSPPVMMAAAAAPSSDLTIIPNNSPPAPTSTNPSTPPPPTAPTTTNPTATTPTDNNPPTATTSTDNNPPTATTNNPPPATTKTTTKTTNTPISATTHTVTSSSPTSACATSLGSLPATCDVLPAPPTTTSNWLVPSRIAIGRAPSALEAKALSTSGITTFVSLVGEYDKTEYTDHEYPSTMTRPADYVHFPIPDRSVPDATALSHFVDDLAHRVLRGEAIYIHCAAGHGRTGTVVIPLLASLYQISKTTVADYVNKCTLETRHSDALSISNGEQPPTLPETDEQRALVEQLPIHNPCDADVLGKLAVAHLHH